MHAASRHAPGANKLPTSSRQPPSEALSSPQQLSAASADSPVCTSTATYLQRSEFQRPTPTSNGATWPHHSHPPKSATQHTAQPLPPLCLPRPPRYPAPTDGLLRGAGAPYYFLKTWTLTLTCLLPLVSSRPTGLGRERQAACSGNARMPMMSVLSCDNVIKF